MSAPESTNAPLSARYGETLWVITSGDFYRRLMLACADFASQGSATLDVAVADLPSSPASEHFQLVLWVEAVEDRPRRKRIHLTGWTKQATFFGGNHAVNFELIAFLRNDDATIFFQPRHT